MAKHLSALQVLSSMSKATPANALRLTDPELYSKIKYEDFFSAIPNLKVDDLRKKQLADLQEEINILNLNKDKYHFREDKIYIYFILSLQEVLSDYN
jgi:hypothetical protein